MKENQIILVKKSWRILRQVDPTLLGSVFYEKLFADQPSLRRLFKSAIDEQSQKLIGMLSVLVVHLNQPEALNDELRELAVRHVGYGVKAEHYHSVGEALLWTLKQGLGHDWDTATEEAWKTCYGELASSMIGAAYQTG